MSLAEYLLRYEAPKHTDMFGRMQKIMLLNFHVHKSRHKEYIPPLHSHFVYIALLNDTIYCIYKFLGVTVEI